MHRLFIALFLALSWASSLEAAPCYGTRMPAKHKFSVGLQNHTLLKRYLEDNRGKVRSLQNLLLLSYGVYDWLSIDLKGGAGYIMQHPVAGDEVDYASGFAGGYGLRVRLLDIDKWKVVSGFQHISVHPRGTHLEGVENKAILDDWQVSLLGSYSLGRFTPYLGSRWSRIDYIHRVEGERKRRMSDFTKDIGLVFGTDLSLTDNIRLNLEGSFLDSDAFAASVNYDF